MNLDEILKDFSYGNNARVVGDFLYVRDENGNTIAGRQVSNGDAITVLDVSYSKQLALIEYPTSIGVRRGYVTNSKIIQYFYNDNWKNGSTSEPVLDLNGNVIGTLNPNETATILYKTKDLTNVIYSTDKGKNTKSGLVKFQGIGNTSVESDTGEKTSFTYPNNAQVVGDFLYVRDSNGNVIPGRQVDPNDNITVLDISYSKQLALVEYRTMSGFIRSGYVTNATSLIRYYNEGNWKNGSTAEVVLDENGVSIGSLSPYETATILYVKNGLTHVVYSTDKGKNTKSGFVKYKGSPITISTNPNNAKIVGDFLYLRDSSGNKIEGKQINDGQDIAILDIGYTKQLALVEYDTSSGRQQGYVTNAVNLIRYYNEDNWKNGSTAETVMDSSGAKIGSLSPYEFATILSKKDGLTNVVYDTDKGKRTKSGFVKYGGEYVATTIPTTSTNLRKIFIDPGHGGYDSGAIGFDLKEKDVNLKIAKTLKAFFEKYGYMVKMSREDDTFVSLTERTTMANVWGADLFISVHINAGGGIGSEVWASINGGIGATYANNVAKAIGTMFLNRGVITKRGQHGDYLHVIRESYMPSILVEYGFIDNLYDNTKLKSDDNLKKLAGLTFQGITGIDPYSAVIIPVQLTEDEKRENNRSLAKLFSVSAKFEQKQNILNTENVEINYLISKEPKIGDGAIGLKLENGVLKGAISGEKVELTRIFEEDKNELELTQVLAVFGDCTINFKFKGEIVPYPQATFTLEFKYDVMKSDGTSYTAYHSIELIVRKPDFWDDVKIFAAAAVIVVMLFGACAASEGVAILAIGTEIISPELIVTSGTVVKVIKTKEVFTAARKSAQTIQDLGDVLEKIANK